MSDDMTEAPRPDPGFRVWVDHGSGQPVVDVTHAVMDVYDIAVNSMDFGSGFLSTEEVGNLRILGKAIGARFDYQNDKCLRCGHDQGNHKPAGPPYCSENAMRWEDSTCTCTGYLRPG